MLPSFLPPWDHPRAPYSHQPSALTVASALLAQRVIEVALDAEKETS